MDASTTNNNEDLTSDAVVVGENVAAEVGNASLVEENITMEDIQDENIESCAVEDNTENIEGTLCNVVEPETECVETDTPNTTSICNAPDNASESSILRETIISGEVDNNNFSPAQSIESDDVIPLPSVSEDQLLKNVENDSSETLGNKTSINEDIVLSETNSVDKNDGDISDKGETSKTMDVVDIDENRSEEVMEIINPNRSFESEETQSAVTTDIEVQEEESGPCVPEVEVDISVEEADIPLNNEAREVAIVDNATVDAQVTDPAAVEVKAKRRSRKSREVNHQQLETSVVENGNPPEQDDDELDDSTSGRPRRKAAKKAGDQIRQIVDNEEDVTEVMYNKKEGLEEWTTAPACPPRKICFQCCRLRSCQYHLLVNGISRYMCTTPCFHAFRKQHPPKNHLTKKDIDPKTGEVITPVDSGGGGDLRPNIEAKQTEAAKDGVLECAFCHLVVLPPTASEKSLSWETMEFCNEDCLGKYQDQLGSSCSQCKVPVQRISMGKYCVRFGYNIKQFCCSTCLEEFKKGLKACTYCQKDISTGAEGFLAPVGDKGQFKDFCSSACMEQYDHISSGTRSLPKEAACAVCDKTRPVFLEVVTGRLGKDATNDTVPTTTVHSLCSEPCFAAFKFVNAVKTEKCESCLRYFDTSRPEQRPATFFYDGGYHCCCRACLNIFILTRRSIVQCNWCRVKKYDFDMIKRISSSGQVLMMCSLNCLSLYHVSISAVSSRRVRCDYCNEVSQAQYHLTMSDATVRNFCSYDCVMSFQSQYSKTPLTLPEEDITGTSTTGVTPLQASQRPQQLTVRSGPIAAREMEQNTGPIPVISSVQSLATSEKNTPKEIVCTPVSINAANTAGINHSVSNAAKVTGASNGLAFRQVIVRPPSAKSVRNKATSCKPISSSKSTECRMSSVDESTQTDDSISIKPALIPVPVPIYVPMPMHMYSNPFPIPFPFPLPIPVPICIPAKLSVEELYKRYKEFDSVTPEEAEILMMAELVVADEPKKESNDAGDGSLALLDSEIKDDSDTGGDDRMNLVMSTPPNLLVDLEESITVSTMYGPANSEGEVSTDDQDSEKPQQRKRKSNGKGRGNKSKRSKTAASLPSEDEDEPKELKASLGVSAWQVWVQQKNSELSKVTSNSRRLKLFKTELLQMTLEELNYALCLFVKEVRKPGGAMYAPDTILYFCLGIQHYLMENGRVDNIFTDLYFEKFTECLDQVAKTFPPLTKETRIISTRVEEEHLWESRQLGAHSPYVLLSTLVFFNTKYFHLWTVEDHAKLTFTNVVKVWRKARGRQSESSKALSSANAAGRHYSLLRYVHPDKVIDEDFLERRVYEQHENINTPLRCPVKLYEFYLSKCPDPMKRCGDVFYLLPERACVPDSPVWYSSIALGSDALGKILHRIKMVKEVNKAYISELSEELPAVKRSSEENREKEAE